MERKKERTCFLYYKEWAKSLLQLPENLRLKIDDAIKRYVLYGDEPDDKEVLFSMFALIRTKIDQDNEAYKERCTKNRNNVNQRWNTNVNERIQTNTNDTDRIGLDGIGLDVNKKNSFSLPLEERQEKFKEEVLSYKEDFPEKMLIKFYTTWAEPMRDADIMAWEDEKKWDTLLRLQNYYASWK